MWTAVLTSLFAEIAFSVLVVRQLHKGGLIYQLPWAGLRRIALTLILSAGSLSLLPVKLADLDDVLLACVMAVFVTTGFLWLCKPLDGEAQASKQASYGL